MLKGLAKISVFQYTVFLILFNLLTDSRTWEDTTYRNARNRLKESYVPVAAVLLGETALRLNPPDPDVFLFLAQTYWRQGRDFYGYRNYLKALKIDPSIGKASKGSYHKVMQESRFGPPYVQ